MESENIDRLLERYLALLDEYTTLRESLSKSQASLYQLLARANFSAERGMRYGPDYYDDRMQAIRLLSIAPGDEGCPRFETVHAPEDKAEESEEPAPGGEESQETKDELEDEPKDGKPAEKESKPKSRDPLRWYGIFTPLPLRQAQSQAVDTVEGIIPKLVTVDAEMKDVEIQIRRARKRRAKAEAAKDKDKVTEAISPATAVEAS